MTNEADKNGMTFVLAALFHAANLTRHDRFDPKASIEQAKLFVAEAKAAGVQPPQDA